MGGNWHASLPVDLHLGGVGRPDPGAVPVGSTGLRLLLHRLHLPLELPGCPQRKAALGVLGEISPALVELGAELRRQDHPALGIERMLVSPYEACCHRLYLPRRSLACVLCRPLTPLRATL